MPMTEVQTRSAASSANGKRPKRSVNGRKAVAEAVDTRFDRRLADVLEHAARIFCEKGYEGASMRDLSRATGMSLAGLYHYFESKEELLYLIQKHAFRTIIDQLKVKLEGERDPEQRVRLFIENHLEYFLANKEAMKVLTHEDETLKNGRGAEVRAVKREYYAICLELLGELRAAEGLDFSARLAVLSLFGMINWIYTWHNPRVDADARLLARQMGDIFLRGVLNSAPPQRGNMKSRP